MSERRSVGQRAVGVLLHLVIFGLIGPAIGGIAVLSFLTAMNSPDAAGLSLVPLALAFGLPVAYVIGMPAALMAGLIVAAATLFVRQPVWLYLLAALTGALCAVVMPRIHGGNLVVPAVLPVAGALAAMICTLVARPFRLASPMPTATAGVV